MKQITSILALVLLSFGAMAQAHYIGIQRTANMPHRLLNNVHVPINHQRSSGIVVNYGHNDSIEFAINQGGAFYDNYAYRIGTNIPLTSDFNNDFRFGATQYDTLIDYSTGAKYATASTPTVVDSLVILYSYPRQAFTFDTLYVNIYQGDITVNANGLVTNTVLHQDMIVLDDNYATTQTGIGLLSVYPNYHFAGATKFSIGFDFRGDTTNHFFLIGGYGDLCNNSCAADTATVGKNAIFDIINSGSTNANLSNAGNQQLVFGSCNGGVYTYNPAVCNAFYLQDWNMYAFLTISPPLNVTINGGNLCQGSSEVLFANATGGTGNYTYSWSGGGTGNNKTITTAGTYSVTVNDGSTVKIASINVTVTPNATLTISSSPNPPCAGQAATGTATATNTGGSTITWYLNGLPISTGPTLNVPSGVTSAGMTVYAVTNPVSGCPAFVQSNSITVSPCSGGLTVSISGNTSFCQGGNTTLLANVSGGTGTSTYAWSGGGTGQSKTVTAAGTYGVTVTNNGQTATASVTVTINPTATLFISSNPVAPCASQTDVFTANASNIGGTTILWFVDGNFATSGNTFTSSTLSAGSVVTANVSPASGCPSSITSNAITITNCNGPVCTADPNVTSPGIWPVNNSIPCASQGIYYSATLTVKNYTTFTFGSNTITVDSIRIDTLSNLPCGLTWTTNKAPRNTYGSGELGCIQLSGTTNDAIGQYQLNIAGTMYAHGLGAIPFNFSQGNVIKDIRVQAQGGTCAPVVNGGTSLTACQPNVVISGNTAICQGINSTLTANASGGNGSYTYQWSTNSTSPSIAVNQGGVYSVTITSNGITATNSVTVTASTPASLSISSLPNPPCANQSNTFTATANNTGGALVAWFVSGNQQTTGNTYTTSSLQVGNQVYAVVAPSNGCPSVQSNTITASNCSGALNVFIAGNQTICSGSSTTLTATVSGGSGSYLYLWSTNSTSASISVTNAGVYYVTVNDGFGLAYAQVTVVSNPAATISISSSPNPPCANQTNNFTANVNNAGGGTTTWYVNGNTQTTGNTFSTSSLQVGNQVYAQVSPTNGCPTVSSNSLTVSNCNGTLNAYISGNQNICAGSSTSLSANASGGSGNYTYHWSNNATTSSISVSNAGTYSVTVNDGSTTATASVTVSTNPAATIIITSNHNPSCANQSNTFTATTANGGTGSINWYVNNTQVSSGVTFSPSSLNIGDVVTAVVNPSTGCPAVTSNSITIANCSGALFVYISGNTTICSGNTTTLTANASGGTSNYTYSWSGNGGTSQSATYSTAGTYNVTVNDGNGTTTATVTISVVPAASIVITSTPTPPCNNQSNTFNSTVNSAGTSPTVTWLVNGTQTFTGSTFTSASLHTGDVVTATVTPSNGCNSATSNQIFITSCNGSLNVFAAGPDTICSGGSIGLGLQVSGGAGTYTYTWSPSAGLSSTTVAQPTASPTVTTTYHVTVSDGTHNGTDSTTVVVKSGPSVTINADETICTGGSITLQPTVTSATGTVTYDWSPTTNLSCSNCQNPVATPGSTAVYSVTVSEPGAGCTALATVTIHVTGAATPTVTLSASRNGSGSPCNGANVFTATPTAGGSPTYAWTLNGNALAGTTNTITLNNATTSDVVKVLMTSSLSCATPDTASASVTIGTCTGIEELALDQHVKLYPNPNDGNFVLSIDRVASQMDIQILNIQGRVIYAEHISNFAGGNQQFNLGSLAKGVYLLKVNTENGNAVKRLVIQ